MPFAHCGLAVAGRINQHAIPHLPTHSLAHNKRLFSFSSNYYPLSNRWGREGVFPVIDLILFDWVEWEGDVGIIGCSSGWPD